MRILQFTTVYPSFAQAFESRLAAGLTSVEVQRLLAETCYAIDRLPVHLEGLGHEAIQVPAVFGPLQRAWAEEHGVRYTNAHWVEELAVARVLTSRPDVLYLDDVHVYGDVFQRRLREVAPGAVVVGHCNVPPRDNAALSNLDLVITSMPVLADRWRALGLTVEVLPLAFERADLEAVKVAERRDLSFTFTGTLGSPFGCHAGRFALIERLLAETPLQIWTEAPSYSWKGRMAATMGRWAVEGFAALPLNMPAPVRLAERDAVPRLRRRYASRFHPAVFGRQNLEILSRTQVAFNNHMDIAGSFANNYRLFEATGMGACLLTDWKSNIEDFFEVDSEIVTYRSAEECIEKANWLLDHDKERADIASAGQDRTLRTHTMAQHASALADVLSRQLASQTHLRVAAPTVSGR